MAVKKLRAPSLTSSPGALAPYGAAIMAPSLGATDNGLAAGLCNRLHNGMVHYETRSGVAPDQGGGLETLGHQCGPRPDPARRLRAASGAKGAAAEFARPRSWYPTFARLGAPGRRGASDSAGARRLSGVLARSNSEISSRTEVKSDANGSQLAIFGDDDQSNSGPLH